MTVAASGILSAPIDALAALVAASTTFQSWTGTASAAAALAYCYKAEVGQIDGSTWKRPFARIGQSEEFEVQRGGYGLGVLVLDFEAAVSADYQEGGASENDFVSALYEFTNKVGAIIADVRTGSEGSAALIVTAITMVVQPQRPREEVLGGAKDDYFWCRFAVHFGLPIP